MNRKLQNKLVNLVVFPLVLVMALYFAYRILDVVILKSVDGYMTMRYPDGSTSTVDFTQCRMTENISGNKQLAVYNDQGRGMVFENTNQGSAVAVLMNAGKKDELLGSGKCHLPVTDLSLAYFSLRRNFRIVQSWKGSVAGECDTENGKVEFWVKVHACR